jgi:hypothetical protein
MSMQENQEGGESLSGSVSWQAVAFNGNGRNSEVNFRLKSRPEDQ